MLVHESHPIYVWENDTDNYKWRLRNAIVQSVKAQIFIQMKIKSIRPYSQLTYLVSIPR